MTSWDTVPAETLDLLDGKFCDFCHGYIPTGYYEVDGHMYCSRCWVGHVEGCKLLPDGEPTPAWRDHPVTNWWPQPPGRQA